MPDTQKAVVNISRFISDTLTMLNDAMHGEDEDDARSFRGEWLRWMRAKATLRRDMSADHEEYVDACRELANLEEL